MSPSAHETTSHRCTKQEVMEDFSFHGTDKIFFVCFLPSLGNMNFNYNRVSSNSSFINKFMVSKLTSLTRAAALSWTGTGLLSS